MEHSDMKIKDGVIMAGLRLPMREVLVTAERIWQQHGQELVVTSALDGIHAAGSLHYYGYALDFRVRYFNDEDKKRVFEALKEELTKRGLLEPYKVILHKTHIHVEWRGLVR